MNKPDYSNKWNFKGKTIIFDVFFTHDFSLAKNPTQCYGFIFDEDQKILIVSSDGVSWNIPGGTVENGETLEETLIREIYEEAAVHIEPASIKPFFYQTTTIEETSEFEGSQLRYIAQVKSMEKFVKDPGGSTQFQKFIAVSELPDYIKWSGLEHEIVKRLKKDH